MGRQELDKPAHCEIRVKGVLGHSWSAWLSLDKADNEPVRFLGYLIATLQTVEPGRRPARLPHRDSCKRLFGASLNRKSAPGNVDGDSVRIVIHADLSVLSAASRRNLEVSITRRRLCRRRLSYTR